MLGDPTIWTKRFKSLDIRFLQCIVSVWPKCRAVLQNQPHEDTITFNLVTILRQDPEARRLFYWLEYHYDPVGYTPDGTAYSRGKIDMAVLLDQDHERYLAYECKRLNVVYRGRKATLASPYVTEGLMRFVTEQYAEQLPVGCMLGYIMDDDVSAAELNVFKAISRRKCDLALSHGPVRDNPVGNVRRFFSRHRRRADGQQIEIRHALLPFN